MKSQKVWKKTALASVALLTLLPLAAAAPAAAKPADSVCYVDASAARWLHGCVQNNTDHAFAKIEEHLDHGIFWKYLPPRRFQPGLTKFAATSNGVLTGTTGYIVLDVNGQDYKLWWEIPFHGTSKWGYDCDNGGTCKTPISMKDYMGTQGNVEVLWTIG
ncbi:hypothetical protein ACIP3B_36510 [Streptomyces anulatus]|uniref:hypothetical protein n=1 Tax=Streptomyces anulatus TaxID=1892 RepID=UPI0033EC7F8F